MLGGSSSMVSPKNPPFYPLAPSIPPSLHLPELMNEWCACEWMLVSNCCFFLNACVSVKRQELACRWERGALQINLLLLLLLCFWHSKRHSSEREIKILRRWIRWGCQHRHNGVIVRKRSHKQSSHPVDCRSCTCACTVLGSHTGWPQRPYIIYKVFGDPQSVPPQWGTADWN